VHGAALTTLTQICPTPPDKMLIAQFSLADVACRKQCELSVIVGWLVPTEVCWTQMYVLSTTSTATFTAQQNCL